MSISFLNYEINILNMDARMPFKYGIATLTSLPHLFLEIELEVDGKVKKGIASDGLAPKWFTKDPNTSFKDDIYEMINVIKIAAETAIQISSASTVFDFWLELYQKQCEWGKEKNRPGLLSSFGVSMVERAMISAFSSAKEKPFHKLINLLGFQVNRIFPDLDNKLIEKALPKEPLSSAEIRHTVGLADYLREDEIPFEELVNDGLPQSLEENVRVYGIKKLKIKLFGDLEKDLPRLLKISDIMKELNQEFSFTLDGNEFFTSATSFKEYWQSLSKKEQIKNFLSKLIFIEQPIHRDYALSNECGECLQNWPDKPKMIIDESDGELYSAHKALELGYSGSSHKNCKGIFKSLANLCLFYENNNILSAEDLCNAGPVALHQDLAIVAVLGIRHVERNGHQYMPGLSMFSDDIQNQILEAHPDLYNSNLDFPSLKIEDGKITLSSINNSPLGVGINLETNQFTALEDWKFESLNLPD